MALKAQAKLALSVQFYSKKSIASKLQATAEFLNSRAIFLLIENIFNHSFIVIIIGFFLFYTG